MFIFDFHWQIQHFLNQFWWPINFLLLVLLVVLGYLAYKKPAYAVGLTTILLPTYLFRAQAWGLPFTFLELCVWVTFFGWLLARIAETTSDRRFAISKFRWPVTLILLSATISLFIAPDWRAAAGLWKAYFIEPILFFLVVANVAKDEKNKKVILWALGISTLAISLLAIYQKFTGFGIFEPGWTGPGNRRVTSLFSSPNAVGLYLGPVVAIYFGWLMAEIKNLKEAILKILIMIPALGAIVFTLSQGTWIGLLAAIIFLGFFGLSKKWTAGVTAALVILALIVPTSRNILAPIIAFQDPAGQNRLTLFEMSKNKLLESPKSFILGAGILGFSRVQDESRDPLKIEPLLYPHNIVLNFWLEIGLLGLLAFGLVIIRFFRQGFNRRRNIDVPPAVNWLNLGIMTAMVTIIVHGMIDVPYFKNDLAILFWIIIGLI
ncbi:O-antigen ligase family protein [Candidatus Falkowbacteria bacterium]|nr:O-antigen ligase family protein [Candidatus Falkowbacteria bacterium]